MTWNARNAFWTGSIPALECIGAFMERQGYMMLNSTPASATSTQFAYPGASPSISGSSNLILWATENTSPAVLHAYRADNLAVELYNSNQAAGGRDNFGNGNKYITPTIANGKVYVGTTAGVGVFGLLKELVEVDSCVETGLCPVGTGRRPVTTRAQS
jgi:hypothetical protein